MLNIPKLRAEAAKVRERAREERLENFKEYFQTEIIQTLKCDFIKDELQTQKTRINTKHSSRVLNNWQKEGIIPSSADEEGKWRKFSKIENIWLNIVSELRNFGVAIDSIRKVKQQLFDSKVKNFSPFEYAVIHSILKEPILLLVYTDGSVNLTPRTLYYQQTLNKTLLAHICINFNQFVEEVYPNNKMNVIIPEIEGGITDKELKLLFCLRTGNYEWIKVSVKTGDTYLIEAHKKIDSKSKVIDIIKNHAYQDIEIKTVNSKIMCFSSTEKIKI